MGSMGRPCPFSFSHFHHFAIHFNMAEAFRAKLEIFEKISENLYCSVCTLIPRQTPIYQTKKRGQIVCAVCKPKSNAKGLIESPLLNDLLASLTIFPCKFRYFSLLRTLTKTLELISSNFEPLTYIVH